MTIHVYTLIYIIFTKQTTQGFGLYNYPASLSRWSLQWRHYHNITYCYDWKKHGSCRVYNCGFTDGWKCILKVVDGKCNCFIKKMRRFTKKYIWIVFVNSPATLIYEDSIGFHLHLQIQKSNILQKKSWKKSSNIHVLSSRRPAINTGSFINPLYSVTIEDQ